MTDLAAEASSPLRVLEAKYKLLVTEEEHKAFDAIEAFAANHTVRRIRSHRNWLDLVFDEGEDAEVVQRFVGSLFQRLRQAKLIEPDQKVGVHEEGIYGLHKLKYNMGDLVLFRIEEDRDVYEADARQSIPGFCPHDHPFFAPPPVAPSEEEPSERRPRRVRVDAPAPGRGRRAPVTTVVDEEPVSTASRPIAVRSKVRLKPPTTLDILRSEQTRLQGELRECQERLTLYSRRKATTEQRLLTLEQKIEVEEGREQRLRRSRVRKQVAREERAPTKASAAHVAEPVPDTHGNPRLQKLLDRGFALQAALAILRSA